MDISPEIIFQNQKYSCQKIRFQSGILKVKVQLSAVELTGLSGERSADEQRLHFSDQFFGQRAKFGDP